MSTTIKTKSSASIRIDTDLLNILKSNAKRDNRSLSSQLTEPKEFVKDYVK